MAILLGGVWLFNFNSPDSLALSVDNIYPTSGSPSGGETVTIIGTGFVDPIAGTPINFSYTNAAQPFTVPTDGIYQLEVWGARGATNAAAGAAGGYSTGRVNLTANTVLYIYTGGQGSSNGTGGFNGGGRGQGTSPAGGGGGTDFRLIGGNWNDANGLLSRLIVAGGGGGGGMYSSGYAGAGGGENGGQGYGYFAMGESGCTSKGGSQTAGGTYSGTGGLACIGSVSGVFGSSPTASNAAGGGGGWYGGAGGQSAGGGSGWVYTASSPTPSGYLPGSEYFLTNASTSNGGNADNGYARITPYTVQTPEVLFDTTPAVCEVVSDTEMTCQTPAHAAGIVPVTVDGVSAGEYEYLVSTFLNLTLNQPELNMSGLPNVLIADYLTANVITNNPTGYSLSLTADDTDLTCLNDTSYKILALDGTKAMTDNHWGYAIAGDGLTAPTTWTGVTNSLLPPAKTSPTATDLTDGDDTVVWFGTRVNMSLPACQYAGSVTFSAIAN